MNKNDNGWRIAVLCGLALVSGACAPSDKQVGSACKNGVCPTALATEGPACLATDVTVEVEVTNDRDASHEKLDTICLPRPLARDAAGRVQCNVLWTLPAEPLGDAPGRCSDLPFLMPSTDATKCVVDQVAAKSADASTADGWFYSEGQTKFCSNFAGSPAIHFTDAARVPVGVLVSLSCAAVQEIAADGKLSPSDGAMCRLPSGSAKHANAVGDICMPKAVPESGFDEREVDIQTGATECATGVCLVFHLHGDPSPGCEEIDAGEPPDCVVGRVGDGLRPACDPYPRCAAPDDVKDRVYCSCRCNSPGSADECKCPNGFACIDALPDGPEGLRGGYCVREGT